MGETTKMSELLRKFRGIVGESQKSVAEALDIPAPSLSFYENGRRIPPFDTLIRLLQYYDVRLMIEADLGKWTFELDGDGDVSLRERPKTEQMGLLSGLEEQEKEDLIAYIRRRRRRADGE